MTAIFYPDLEVRSPNGELTFEARSPHNGTINHKDGRSPSDSEYGFKYRCHQDEFRYRLIDNTDPIQGSTKQRHVLWERWQPRGEDSPHELIVSDDGWCIIRTHGFRPEIIAVSPDGTDVACVQLINEGNVTYRDTPLRRSWILAHVAYSTAGLYWSSTSWPYFDRIHERPIFAWRTSWGQRLVIDLENGNLHSEEEQSTRPLATQLVEAEKQGVWRLLSDLSRIWQSVRDYMKRPRVEDEPPQPKLAKVGYVKAALHLVGKHSLRECLPFLRQWEEIDLPGASMGTVTKEKWWLEHQHFRPIVHHSIRLLNEEPKGFATYHFLNVDCPEASQPGSICDLPRIPIPERIGDRAARKSKLDPHMSVQEVLRLLGSPDHISRRSRKEGKYYKWYEGWEYDFRNSKGWTTLRIAWKENNGVGQIIGVNEKPAPWMNSDKREAEILREFL
jgi:hypothetical protein